MAGGFGGVGVVGIADGLLVWIEVYAMVSAHFEIVGAEVTRRISFEVRDTFRLVTSAPTGFQSLRRYLGGYGT